MTTALLSQLPRFSAYDPGQEGEGSLDPVGLSPIAERIADLLVPGIRARMTQPLFAPLAAAGAHACRDLISQPPADHTTTADIAFEWLVVEALAQHRPASEIRNLPGIQKARRARAAGQRIGVTTYLAGPRVFGFTGVYRPFSVDAQILNQAGLPATHSDELLAAWEQERGLDGFVSGTRRSDGGTLRHDIEKACAAALRAGEVTVKPNSKLMRQIAAGMNPVDAGDNERGVMRRLIMNNRSTPSHEVRAEIGELLLHLPTEDMRQREVAEFLISENLSDRTRSLLKAAAAYEECATTVDTCFRFLLQDACAHGGEVSISRASQSPDFEKLAEQLPAQVERAVDAAANIEDDLAVGVVDCFTSFQTSTDASTFADNLLSRHREVQERKSKRSWLDPYRKTWLVRRPYRNQQADLSNRNWIHPMRLTTLSRFLQETR